MARPNKREKKAKRTTIYLNPAEDLALSVIENSRRRREERNCERGDIMADAIWLYLEKVEGKTRDQIEALLPPLPLKIQPQNVTEFPKKK